MTEDPRVKHPRVKHPRVKLSWGMAYACPGIPENFLHASSGLKLDLKRSPMP